jgi:predicted HNH restriction endonuclease
MINKHYRENALKTYGDACEICGRRTGLEVHHIDYQEQWEMESKIRLASKKNWSVSGPALLETARKLGYDTFEFNQLSKNDDTKNLSVLCGNCHSLIHTLDSGKKLLKAIKERK